MTINKIASFLMYFLSDFDPINPTPVVQLTINCPWKLEAGFKGSLE